MSAKVGHLPSVMSQETVGGQHTPTDSGHSWQMGLDCFVELEEEVPQVTKKKPKIVQPGSVVRVVVQLDQAVPLEIPARIVLRANGETVGAGLIE